MHLSVHRRRRTLQAAQGPTTPAAGGGIAEPIGTRHSGDSGKESMIWIT